MVRLTREDVENIVKFARKKGEYVDLSGADLSEIDLFNSNVVDLAVDLIGANFSNANLSRMNLRGAELIGANLYRAELLGTNLSMASLIAADLSEADLDGAYLYGTNLDLANFTRAIVGWTKFDNVDLSTVKGLDTVRHLAPSTIGIDTIFRSKGKIPEAFLQGAGIPDTFITYITSLTGEAIQYYSCFISYSSKDDNFAQRLHADLQQKGVRCWFAPEDMKIGDKIRPRIDESIRIHDKLLLILSEHSINSTWVETEVETAFAEEHKRKQTVLFPVRLDDAVITTDQAWATHIRNTRHIGDFSRWKDDDAYQGAFERLLRDLQAEG